MTFNKELFREIPPCYIHCIWVGVWNFTTEVSMRVIFLFIIATITKPALTLEIPPPSLG